MPSGQVAAVETWVCPLETGQVASSLSSLPLVSRNPPPIVPQPLCCVATASLGGGAGFKWGVIL